jgi:LysM repeat protein
VDNPNRNLTGVIIAVISFLLVGGALVTTLAQSGLMSTPAVSPTITAIQNVTVPVQPTSTSANDNRPTATDEAGFDSTQTLVSTFTLVPSETLTTLTVTAELLPSATGCVVPSTWIKYTVQSGDTLYSIARNYQTTVSTLQQGNCMGGSTRIITGQTIYVPNNPTLTPTQTKTPTKTQPPPTKTPTAIVCYVLTRNHTGNGSNPSASPTNSDGCPSGSFTAGEIIELTAVPDSGYQVESWSGTDDDSSAELINTLTMPTKDHTVSVAYELIPPVCYTLTLSHTGQGLDPTALPANSSGCSPGTYIEGEVIDLTASPDPNNTVGSWTGSDDDGSTSETNTVTMPGADRQVTVNYVAQ